MVRLQTGSIFELVGISRICIVANTIQLDGNKLTVVYPLSNFVQMAGDADFIIMDESCLPNNTMMAESWNSLAVSSDCLGKYIGRLSKGYMNCFASFVYFKNQSSKNPGLQVLTGPPLRSNDDIRYLFRAQELESMYPLRGLLIKQPTIIP